MARSLSDRPVVQERDNLRRRLKKIAGVCAVVERRATIRNAAVRDTITTDELWQIRCLAVGKVG